MKALLDVTDPEAAKILTDTAQLRLLEPFFKADVTLSEVARQFDIKLNTLHYRVKKWLELGIVEVAGEEPRRGRATKLYRCTAKRFFVPFEQTPNASLAELLFTLIAKEEKLFQREAAKALRQLGLDIGLLVMADAQGQVSVVFADAQQRPIDQDSFFGTRTPALYFGDGVVHLDFATAKAFQNDLFELYKRYSAQQTPDAQAYAYRLGLTPLSDTDPDKG